MRIIWNSYDLSRCFGIRALRFGRNNPCCTGCRRVQLIDAHCRRSTLGVAQYEERLRIAAGPQHGAGHLLPLAMVAPAATLLFRRRGAMHSSEGRLAFRRYQVRCRADVRIAGRLDRHLCACNRFLCRNRRVDVTAEHRRPVVQRSRHGLHSGLGRDSRSG